MGKMGFNREQQHRDRVKRKHDDIETWKALKAEWELAGLQPDDPEIKRYERKIHILEVQLKAMRP